MRQILISKKSIWPVILLAMLFFLALAALLEIFARTAWLDKVSPYRSVGNFHYQFELKWFRLQDYVEQNGGVDIIIVGSSLVNTGIDPDVMAQTYYEQTGSRPRIFNFGVEGMTIAPNSAIAGLLVEKYHPAMLVYVTDMRDYVAANGLYYEGLFLSDPWVRYKLGGFNFLGWLDDHSAALQHYLPYRDWMRSDYPDTISLYIKRYHDTTASGYEPDQLIGENVDSLPNPSDPNEIAYFKLLGNYRIAGSRLENLHSILAFKQSEGTSIWIVEMPVSPTFYAYVGGEEVHQQFQQEISSFVEANGGSFLPAETCLGAIPLEGRSNRWHLNYIGAPCFSECLGEQLVILMPQGNADFATVAGPR
jgi:hypothetical protein